MITCIDYFAGIGAWELAAEILEQIYGYQVFTTYQFVEILLAREQVKQELRPDLTTQSQTYGLKPSGVSALASPNLSLLSNLKDLSIEDYERALEDSEWQDTVKKLKLSRHRSLAHPTDETESLLLPTPTTYPCSNGKGGNAGMNKLENTLRSQNRLSNTLKLNPQFCLWMMQFPDGYLDYLIQNGGNSINHR
ncbi:hypothetical protein QHH11_02640 [Aphanizomenon sp. PH219]|nr:hypothetical protein [Aphanizomenon sp. 202]MDK2458048.1 hypothetical protein [Aphanizomenon sp. PH219]